MTLVDMLSWCFLTVGGACVLIGGVGAIRLPNFYTRVHAASLTDTMGTILVLVGIMFQSGASLATIKLLAIMIFLLLTGPTATYALVNAALMSGLKPRATTINETES